MKINVKRPLLVSLFAITMGFLEAAVVIYLREIYYKDGFQFPLKPMSMTLVRVEILRELATIMMLIVVGYLAGKTKLQRFAYFCWSFAVWDIFYYIFLYLFLGWPQSLFTWDILFLIPLPWVGPVWAPCVLSSLMLAGSLFVIVQCDLNINFNISKQLWYISIIGSIICILSFTYDYMDYKLMSFFDFSSEINLFKEMANYIPSTFNTPLFTTGLICMSIPLFYVMFNHFKIKQSNNR